MTLTNSPLISPAIGGRGEEPLSSLVVDKDPLLHKPVVILCYEALTPKEKTLTMSVVDSLFPNRPMWFAPAEAGSVVVEGIVKGKRSNGPTVRYRQQYLLQALRTRQFAVHGPKGSDIESLSFRVAVVPMNPWTCVPIVLYLDPMPDHIPMADRRRLQPEMLLQLGRWFWHLVGTRKYSIVNCAFGFAQALPQIKMEKKAKTVRKGRRL